jgi:SRSO17 transposase
VGVQRQHCGALGKKANCQCAVSLHYVAPKGHCPLSMRLFLPPAWLADPARLERAGVPSEQRRDLTKGQIALELLDQARAEGWPSRLVVADSGYGVSGPFRRELEMRGLYYVVGVTEQMIVFAEPPRWQWPDAAVRGRSAPRSRPRAGQGCARTGHPGGVSRPHALTARDLAQRDQRAVKRPVCLATGLAGLRLGGGRMRRGPTPLALNRTPPRRHAPLRLGATCPPILRA